MAKNENPSKRITVSAPLLICYSLFTVWQMGIVFYSGTALSLDGKTPLPISVENITTVIVAAYLLSIVFLIFFQKYSVVTARTGILISLASAAGTFFPFSAGILAFLINAQIFCCVFLIGVSISVVVHLFDENSEILDVLITSVLGSALIAVFQNDTVKIPFHLFRAFTVLALAALLIFFFRIPAETHIKYARKSDGVKRPVRFTIGIFFLIGLSCMLTLFGNTVGESIRNGVSIIYFSTAVCGTVVFILWKIFRISPLRCATVLTGIAAAGFVLATAGGELPVLAYVSCAMLGCGFVSCSLSSFFGIVLFKRYPSRFITPAITAIGVATVILHSALLEAFRNRIYVLYIIYAVAAVIATVLFLLVEPSLIWSMRRVENDNGKTDSQMPKVHEAVLNVSASELDRLLAPFSVEPLSGQELRIAGLILNGYTSAEMVDILGITLNTVKSYRKNLHSKLQIHSRRELFALVNDKNAYEGHDG